MSNRWQPPWLRNHFEIKGTKKSEFKDQTDAVTSTKTPNNNLVKALRYQNDRPWHSTNPSDQLLSTAPIHNTPRTKTSRMENKGNPEQSSKIVKIPLRLNEKKEATIFVTNSKRRGTGKCKDQRPPSDRLWFIKASSKTKDQLTDWDWTPVRTPPRRNCLA